MVIRVAPGHLPAVIVVSNAQINATRKILPNNTQGESPRSAGSVRRPAVE